MKVILQLCALAILLHASLSERVIPSGRNIKTSIKELNLLEKFLTQIFHPEIPFRELLAQESENDRKNGHDDNTFGDLYAGYIEWFNIELPLFLLQLHKMGDEIPLPTFQYEFGLWRCSGLWCEGFLNVFNFRQPILRNATTASLSGSVNGTELRLKFLIGNIEVLSPDFTLEEINFGEYPPSTSETTIWNNATIFIKNYALETTVNIAPGPKGLEVSGFNLEWSMDDFRIRFENGTHVFSDGRQEALDAKEELLHESFLKEWHDNLQKQFVEDVVQFWLNCFLTNGRSEEGCEWFLDNNLHRQTFAELIHAFGLNGLNKAREAELRKP